MELTNLDTTWYIIITQYFCHITFCKRLQMSHSIKFCKSCHISPYCTLILSASLLLLEALAFSSKRTASCFNVSKMYRNGWGFRLKGKCSHHLHCLPPSKASWFFWTDRSWKSPPILNALQRIHFVLPAGHYLALGCNNQWFLRGRMTQNSWRGSMNSFS